MWQQHSRIPQLDIANMNIARSSHHQQVFETVKGLYEEFSGSSPRVLPVQPSRSMEIVDCEATVDSTQEDSAKNAVDPQGESNTPAPDQVVAMDQWINYHTNQIHQYNLPWIPQQQNCKLPSLHFRKTRKNQIRHTETFSNNTTNYVTT